MLSRNSTSELITAGLPGSCITDHSTGVCMCWLGIYRAWTCACLGLPVSLCMCVCVWVLHVHAKNTFLGIDPGTTFICTQFSDVSIALFCVCGVVTAVSCLQPVLLAVSRSD